MDTIDKFPVYGVKWENKVSGASNSILMERTDDAVELSFNIDEETGECYSDFDNLSPWNGEIVYDSAGNKFKKFPSAWIRVGIDDNGYINSVAVSEQPTEEGNWYHYDEFWYACYGASELNGKLASLSGVDRITRNTRAEFREKATANGDGYQQLDIYHKMITVFLWWIEFAKKPSNVIMTGRINGSGALGGNKAIPTGGTDSVQTPSGFELQYAQMKWHGIEDFIGNVLEFVDGTTGAIDGHVLVCKNPSTFSDEVLEESYEQVSFIQPTITSASRYVQAFGWDENHPFMVFPTEANLSSRYFYNECELPDLENAVLVSGSCYTYSSYSYGLVRFEWEVVSRSHPSIGGRLLYIPYKI